MIIWFATLIPIIACIVGYLLWPKKLTWFELLIPTTVCFLFIILTKFSVEKALLDDTQYLSGTVMNAQYYEYWSTWISKKCPEQYACGSYTTGSGKNKTRHTKYCTRWVDCSYCDKHSEYWQITDNYNHIWSVTKEEYERLGKQWNSRPVFVDQDRHIVNHFGCGEDGDMYQHNWDSGMLSIEGSTWTESYENHVQISKSSFNIGEVSKEDVKKHGLYEYPTLQNYHQTNILGLDSATFVDTNHKLGAAKLFEYFNSVYGPKRKIKVFVLMFYGKDIETAVKQKNYWVNGNKNEVVICIDVDRATGKINWVYPFSWTENKRIQVDIREDVSNMKVLDFTKLYHTVDEDTKSFAYRDFHQFDYLSVDPPTWEVWFVYLFTIALTIGILYGCVTNEIENE